MRARQRSAAGCVAGWRTDRTIACHTGMTEAHDAGAWWPAGVRTGHSSASAASLQGMPARCDACAHRSCTASSRTRRAGRISVFHPLRP